MLQAQSSTSLLRGGAIAPFGFAATGILHGMAFVEDNDPVEVGPQPIDDLLHPRNPVFARVGA